MQTAKKNSYVFLALLFPLTLFGYSTIAPLFNKFAPEGSTASILFRAFVLLLSFVAVFFFRLKMSRQRALLLFPLFLFLGMYTLRLFDNYYIQQLPMYAPPELVFGILIGSAILPAWIIAQAVSRINERSFIYANMLMIAIFLIGLAFNFDKVIEMVGGRSAETQLMRLNAISLSAVAGSYALFLIIMGKVGVRMNLVRIGIILLLLGIVVITRSRGPLLGMIGAIMIYFFFVSGYYKKYLFRLLIIIAIAILIATPYFGIDFVGVAIERLIGDGTKYSIDTQVAQGTGRIGMWIAAWEQFLENPILGNIVYESYQNSYPHNIILESLISLGIVGTAILLLSLFIAVVSSIRLLRGRNSTLIERFSALMFFKIFIQVQFSSAIWGTTLWIAMAVVISLAVAKRQRSISWQRRINLAYLSMPAPTNSQYKVSNK